MTVKVKVMSYMALAYFYYVDFMMNFGYKAMIVNKTNYSCDKKAVELV